MNDLKNHEFYYSNLKEKYFSSFMNNLINNLLAFARKTGQISSVVAVGSLARKRMQNYSNLSLVFWMSELKSNLFENIQELLDDILTFSIQKKNKFLFYVYYAGELESRILLVEINLVYNSYELGKLLLGTNIEPKDIDSMLLVTKEENNRIELSDLLIEIQKNKDNITTYILEFINNFIEYFQKALACFKKSDFYQYYNYMTQCLLQLVRLECIIYQNTENLLQPVFSLTRMDFNNTFPFYNSFTPTISFSTFEIKREYIKKFLSLLEKLNQNYNLHLQITDIEKFLHELEKENYFWNLRDIAYIDSQRLKKGILFRSGSLSLYDKEQELQEFLNENAIRTILDIRRKNELPMYMNLSPKIHYINIPLEYDREVDQTKVKYVSIEHPDSYFETFLRFAQKSIKEIFYALANAEPGIVIHCMAGRDRTGIIIGLLLNLLAEHTNITKELIIEDFLNSGHRNNPEVFEILNAILQEYGGIKEYLLTIGLEEKSLIQIKEKITKS